MCFRFQILLSQLLSKTAQPIPATIQVPELQTTEVQTRVSVPDKGTLAFGRSEVDG